MYDACDTESIIRTVRALWMEIKCRNLWKSRKNRQKNFMA